MWETLAQFKGSQMSPGLLQDFMDRCVKPRPLVVEHRVVVMAAGFQ